MPVTFLDYIPFPSVRVYTAVSVLLVSLSIYQAVNVTSDPGWKVNSTILSGSPDGKTGNVQEQPNMSTAGIVFGNETRSVGRQVADVASFMMQEPVCIWSLINMAYCSLFTLGRCIQRAVFGELRVSERQQAKDKFWNFVFYKFIFVFGVINVQYMDEVLLWVAWFTALGFLNLLAQLCKDRFEYLSFSASSGGWAGARLAALLGSILALDGLLMMLCVAVGLFGGDINTFAFMTAECILLSIRTMHVIFRYGMHIVEARGAVAEERRGSVLEPATGAGAGTGARDRRAPLAHYAELGFELTALAVELAHHLHMLLWSNVFLSMASLVICMQLRYLFHEIQRRVRKHRNYLWVLNHMERNYPMATEEELTENSDNCAICWEKMDTARKLPCGHLFHNSCLSSWLQQDTSCPTCRLGLSLWPSRSSELPSQARQPNHFFHFDGSRYVSWLPSFSVEVTHIMRAEPQATNSQIDAMARQVQQLFPHFPLSSISRDLLQTHSVELTVENILDGRLVLPLALDGETGAVERTEGLGLRGTEDWQLPVAGPQVLLQHSLSMLAGHLAQSQPISSTHSTSVQPPAHHHGPTPQEDSTENETPIEVRFLKCSYERKKILNAKKEQLISNARKRYLEKQAKVNQQGSTKTSQESQHSHLTQSEVVNLKKTQYLKEEAQKQEPVASTSSNYNAVSMDKYDFQLPEGLNT